MEIVTKPEKPEEISLTGFPTAIIGEIDKLHPKAPLIEEVGKTQAIGVKIEEGICLQLQVC